MNCGAAFPKLAVTVEVAVTVAVAVAPPPVPVTVVVKVVFDGFPVLVPAKYPAAPATTSATMTPTAKMVELIAFLLLFMRGHIL